MMQGKSSDAPLTTRLNRRAWRGVFQRLWEETAYVGRVSRTRTVSIAR